MRGVFDVDAQCAVVGLGARRPGRGTGRGVGDVVGLSVLAQRVGGVLPRQRQGVEAVEDTAGTLLIVAGDRDLRIAHAVTDQQDHVARRAVVDRGPDGTGLIAVESARPSGCGEVTGGLPSHGVAVGFRVVVAAAGHQRQHRERAQHRC